jgi:1-acyl-sn-glycerol-3-phosphate acyltransferase
MNGVENIPNPPERIIVVANHFCSLDSMLLGALLPFQPVFLMAAESDRHRFMHFLSKIFEPITVRRGSSDRQAIQRAVDVVSAGASLAIFPEGVVNPETALLVERGDPNDSRRRELVRPCAMLIHARPGAAYLAAKSDARILPIGLYGTQDLMKRFKQVRRVPVQLNVGQPIGPFSVDPCLKGRERRNAVEVISRTIMEQISAQLPPDARGEYTARSGAVD